MRLNGWVVCWIGWTIDHTELDLSFRTWTRLWSLFQPNVLLKRVHTFQKYTGMATELACGSAMHCDVHPSLIYSRLPLVTLE